MVHPVGLDYLLFHVCANYTIITVIMSYSMLPCTGLGLKGSPRVSEPSLDVEITQPRPQSFAKPCVQGGPSRLGPELG